MLRNLLLPLLLFSCFVVQISQQAWAVKVTYIADTNQLTSYWQKVYDIANAAARDLDIELTLIEGQGHRILQAKIIEEIAKQTNKPDMLVFMGHQENARQTFALLEQAKIPFITLSNFEPSNENNQGNKVGLPQETFKYWLAEHYDDHAQGAYKLLDELIKQARKVQPEKPLKVLAIQGDFSSQARQKHQGIQQRLAKENQVILVQEIVSYWQYTTAKSHFKALYQRHKGVDIVLAASDTMAIAAMEGAKELGLTPNQDIFIGGFDWNTRAIRAIKHEQLAASAGGHMFSVAWLLVKIYDHFNHHAVFHSGKQKPSSQFDIINFKNLQAFEQLAYETDLDKINFYCFSKTYTQQAEYNFSVNALLTQLARTSNANCVSKNE